MRLIYLAIFILVTATTFYFMGGLGLLDEWEEPVVVKKVSAVKPKSLINKAEALKPVSHQFTFFETLEDKTMTKYVGLHGEMLPVSLPVVLPPPEKANSSSVVSPAKSNLKLKASETIREEIKPSARFAVQVSSFRDEERAGALKIKLQKKGFDAFIMETELPNHGGKWYRVFLGKYSDEKLARKDAERARQEYNLNAVVVRKTL